MIAIIVLFLSVVIFFVWILSKSGKKLPPGPRGKPLIGILTEVDMKKMHQQLCDWANKYGPILSFNVLGKVTVVLNDENLVREAYSSSAFSSLFNDRPYSFFGKYVLFENSNVALAAYNEATMKLRKVMHKGLHFYGDGVKQ